MIKSQTLFFPTRIFTTISLQHVCMKQKTGYSISCFIIYYIRGDLIYQYVIRILNSCYLAKMKVYGINTKS